MFDPSTIRLFVTAPLSAGASVPLAREQSHYLTTVMRRAASDPVIVFNGEDGEWLAHIAEAHKKSTVLALDRPLRPQAAEPDVWLLFAPLKKDRTDFIVEKATELGAARLMPVLTERTQTNRVNTARLQATAIEAAEQSRRLGVPAVAELTTLMDALADWPADRRLVFMDESGGGAPLADVLAGGDAASAFLIGPEGGFAPGELDALRNLPFSVAADLGPRILRAETAVVAALAIRQAMDDRQRAHFDNQTP